MRVDLQDGDVSRRILIPPTFASIWSLSGERDLHAARARDDVVVGHDVAGLVDHEAGAERLLGLRHGRKAEGIDGLRAHGRGGDLDDARRVALVDPLGSDPCGRRLERGVRDACAAADRRDLLDRRMAAELPEHGRACKRHDAARQRDGPEFGRTKREEVTARHVSVITTRCWRGVSGD